MDHHIICELRAEKLWIALENVLQATSKKIPDNLLMGT